MERDKHVDESWKESVAKEKGVGPEEKGLAPQEKAHAEEDYPMEINFVNYISSLAFQALIFLGEIPNPITQKTEQNFPQAKFLIDTLVLLREKTKGNLNQEENDLLNAGIYELQMKFVERTQKGTK